MKEFTPPAILRNPHLMTIAGALWRRKFPRLPTGESRYFAVDAETQALAVCHWHAERASHPTLVVLHGLEGSSDSGYMRGTAEKAFTSGFNVVRLNQRSCGGADRLSPGLYHSGRSGDIRTVILELIERDALPEIFAAGFSMGGNIVLKMAGEFADAAPPELRAFVAVAPAMELAACAAALEARRNFIYETRFVRALKRRMREKARLFPGRYHLNGLDRIRSVREFDDVITAPNSGFRDAADYYAQSSANQLLGKIARPTLIVTAQDDPVVPFAAFQAPAVGQNPNITLIAPRHGGHCAFISNEDGGERFWVEPRIVEFCAAHSKLLA